MGEWMPTEGGNEGVVKFTMTVKAAYALGVKERDLSVTTNLDEYGEDVADAYEYGRRGVPIPNLSDEHFYA